MQYGVCCKPDMAEKVKEAGYQFIEGTVEALLKPRRGDEAFDTSLAELKEAPLNCPIVNSFLPPDLKVTGPQVDLPALERYTRTTFGRAKAAGVETIVFGSGEARRIPEGFDRERAHGQLVDFCRMIAPVASAHGVEIVVEPLNRNECNVLTSLGESADLVREVDHPAVRLLVDSYHLMLEDDSYEDIVINADLITHVHVATEANRLPPGAEECDFFPFFEALVRGGYDGRISIEAKIQDPDRDLPKALSYYMKEMEKMAKEKISNQAT